MTTLKANATGVFKPNIWFMPEESESHQRTWMSFITSVGIWQKEKILPMDIPTLCSFC